MATFVLIPGAGGDAHYWDLLIPELRRLGHEGIAVDIREDDPSLGLPEYAEAVVSAASGRTGTVLVAQSMGAFTAAMVADQLRPQMIVLVNAMIPVPGETPGEWWGSVGAIEARTAADQAAGRPTEFDVETHFLHDVPDDVKQGMFERPPREPADTPFGQPCEFEHWPEIPIKVVVGADDRFFPADFQRAVARARLGLDADVIRGGHLLAIANPAGLAERLAAYVEALSSA